MFGVALRGARLRYKLGRQQRRHPLRYDWWRALVPALGAITVPALVCGSFSVRYQGRRRLLGMERARGHGDHRPDGPAALDGGARHR